MKPRGRIILACGLGLLVVSAASRGGHAQQQRAPVVPAGTAQLGGVVTSTDDARQPIRRVLVRLAASELRGGRDAVTDDQGRFIFTELPAGRYTITASRPGYLDTAYGAKRVRGAGTPISLAQGQRELGIRLPLPRGAVITGAVTDPFGLAVAYAQVHVLEKTIVNGQATLVSRGLGSTDDRGMYRVYGLPPGAFVVSVTPLSQFVSSVRQTTEADVKWVAQPPSPATGRLVSPPPPAGPLVAVTQVFYPGTTDAAAAATVSLETGAERLGVNIPLRFVPVARLAGLVTRPDGAPAAGVSLNLVPQTSGVHVPVQAQTPRPRATMGGPGEFIFASVEPGRYTLTAQASSSPTIPGRGAGDGGGPAPRDLWAQTTVDVTGQDITGLRITLEPTVTVSGRVIVETTAGATPPSRVTVSVTPPPSADVRFTIPGVSVAADQTFTIRGAVPGSYLLSATAPNPTPGPGARPVWAVKSVQVQGRDVLDRFFDLTPGRNIDDVVITLTDKLTSLTGKLMDGQGKPAPEYVVILISVDRAYWVQGMSRGPRSARPANDGTFRFEAIPPGEYYVAAATDFETSELYDAASLEHLIPAAIKLLIAEGEKKVQDLKIGG